MSKIALVICLLHLVMFILGFNRYQFEKSKLSTDSVLYETLEYIYITEHHGTLFLSYQKGPSSPPLYLYDIENNKLSRASIDTIELEKNTLRDATNALVLTDPTLIAAIGGVTLGFPVKDILRSLLKGKLKRDSSHGRNTLHLIFAVLSGYGLGYMAANNFKSAPEDPRLIKFISAEENWIKAEGYLYFNLWRRIEASKPFIVNSLKQEKHREYDTLENLALFIMYNNYLSQVREIQFNTFRQSINIDSKESEIVYLKKFDLLMMTEKETIGKLNVIDFKSDDIRKLYELNLLLKDEIDAAYSGDFF